MRTILANVFLAAGVAGVAYLAIALERTFAFRRRQRPASDYAPPLTVLKPLCGLEPGLFENLCSYCDQDYPVYQVIFGIRDADDPAISVVQHVMALFSDRDVTLLVDGRVRGSNLKIASVMNMMERAKHDILIVADSDTRVDRSYLRSVVAPFANESVGAATCLYRGTPNGGATRATKVTPQHEAAAEITPPHWVAQLGAMFINEQFAPSVLVAIVFSPMDFCLGATMAVTRRALEAIGGFARLSSRLGDDQLLGKLVRDAGWAVELSSYVVENVVNEHNLRSLWAHELRWARTMSVARPWGYAFSFITYAVPVTLTYLVLARSFTGVLLATAAIALRVALHYVSRQALDARSNDALWLILPRDILGLGVWAASFFGRNVKWRERKFSIDAAGEMRPDSN